MSVSVRVSARWPVAVGVNVTLMVQVPWGLMAALQVLVLAKSPGLLPPATTEEMVRAAVPLLVTVTVWGALAAPWLMAAKVTVLDESVTEGVAGGGGVCDPE